METKEGYLLQKGIINPSGLYFYETDLEGKRIKLPISGIGLALRIGANRILDKALEIASKDAYCSQQSVQESHEQDCQRQG